MKITLNVPYIMYFNDYHEIVDFADRFNELTGGKPKLKYTEIMGESDYGYKALFYFNKQDRAYKAVLAEYKASIKDEDE
jgi:hypothetical protein